MLDRLPAWPSHGRRRQWRSGSRNGRLRRASDLSLAWASESPSRFPGPRPRSPWRRGEAVPEDTGPRGRTESPVLGASCPSEPRRASLSSLRFHGEDERRRRSQLEAHLGHLTAVLCVVLVKSIRSTPAYLAETLYYAMKGAGTDGHTLIRVVVSRSEIDLLNIRKEFRKSFAASLYSMIKGDTSGDSKKTLLLPCGGEDD